MQRDVRRYLKDPWNVLDVLGMLCLFVGLVFRWADEANPWGPAFYAMCAPLVVCRVLFFAQILPFQGPMIQASASMYPRTLLIVRLTRNPLAQSGFLGAHAHVQPHHA